MSYSTAAVWMPADKRRRRHVDAFVAGMMRKMEFVLAIYGTSISLLFTQIMDSDEASSNSLDQLFILSITVAF